MILKFILCMLFSNSSFASDSDSAEIKTSVLKDGKWEEACIKSKLGMRINYSFEADRNINFNIHWHEKKHVTYSVKHDGLKKLKGSFEPSVEKTYCLSWYEPTKEAATVKYSYSHKPIVDQ